MRPAIEVYRCASYEDAKLYGSIEGEEAAAAVIEAYAAEREAAAHAKAVAEIVAELRDEDERLTRGGALTDASHLADHIETKFGGRDG